MPENIYSTSSEPEREQAEATTGEHGRQAEKAAGYVIGVDIGGTNLRLALADSSGEIAAKWSATTVGLRDPKKVIRLILDGVQSALSQLHEPASVLRSIAIGVPGITDVANGVVVATSYLMGWRNVPLREFVEEELKLPAIVDNDVNLAAIGESSAGAAKGIPDFVFLAIGTGIGAGIFLNGRIYRGSCWGAGEVGYMLVPGIAVNSGKPHEPGSLERMIGGEGIREHWQKRWSAERTSLPREMKATEIFDQALLGEAEAAAILQQSAAMLAQAIYNISLVLNCPLVVLGGSVGMHPALRDATEIALKRWNLRGAPRLTTSSLGVDAQLRGAVRAALDLVVAT